MHKKELGAIVASARESPEAGSGFWCQTSSTMLHDFCMSDKTFFLSDRSQDRRQADVSHKQVPLPEFQLCNFQTKFPLRPNCH